jgi:transposase
MTPVMLLTGPERRRRWRSEERSAILAAAFTPGAVVAEVARQFDVSTSLVYKWRRDCMESNSFAPVVLAGPPARQPGAQVLVADDNPSVREISRCILEAAGAHVMDANDGLSAVALASAQRFDILFIDLNMPGISGKEVVKYPRSLGMNTRAPIYAFTANGAFTASEAKAEGFDGLFTKPIDPRKMVSLVHSALVQRTA